MLLPFRHHGVLGLNARSLLYIKPFNRKKAVAFADDKMKTKAFLSARGIPAAKLFARIDSRRQLRQFNFKALPDECVLKPNYGFGGEGIIILKGRRNGEFLEQGKTPIGTARLTEHIEDILDGKFSVNGMSDSAFFEKILVTDDCFAPFRPAGLPDIRIIVFNLVPVMAMLRIPTAESGGKANVHLGGLGVGIDIAKGVTTHAVKHHSMVERLSHGGSVSGIQIPRWEELLLIASKIQYITNIGYLAVDLTLDKEMGPVLLEVNARAGLMVQVANLAPLRSRLDRVEGLQVSTPEKGVRLARELFGETVKTREIKKDDQPILALRETIGIAAEGVQIEEPCAIAPETQETIFSASFIEELLRVKAAQPMPGHGKSYRVKFTLGGRKIQTVVDTGTPEDPSLRISIGARDLKGFLIDPSTGPNNPLQIGMRTDLRAVDRMLCAIDRELSSLKYLRPLNVNEERERLLIDEEYQPVFLLRDCDIDLAGIEKTLNELRSDETPLGILLSKKRRELMLKTELIRHRGNVERFIGVSQALYGAPSPALIGFAKEYLKEQRTASRGASEENMKTAEQAKPLFEAMLVKYGLHDWLVEVKRGIVADCSVGEKRIFLRSGALFSDEHIRALLAHEIETHVLTSENGRLQPYEIFRRGFANYLDTQEGLAIYNQNRVLPADHEKRFFHAKSVLAVAYAMDHSFAETRAYLKNELGCTPEKSLSKAIELKRGFVEGKSAGAFTKSLVYFRGYRAVDQFVRFGGDVRTLYVGKVALEDLDAILGVDGVKQAALLPFFLQQPPEKPIKTRKGRKKP